MLNPPSIYAKVPGSSTLPFSSVYFLILDARRISQLRQILNLLQDVAERSQLNECFVSLMDHNGGILRQPKEETTDLDAFIFVRTANLFSDFPGEVASYNVIPTPHGSPIDSEANRGGFFRYGTLTWISSLLPPN